MKSPPNDLPAYRVLTGPDDAAFCHRVSEALALGYELYGPPAVTFDGARVVVAQAIVWPGTKYCLSIPSHNGSGCLPRFCLHYASRLNSGVRPHELQPKISIIKG
jgi:hypothetical protein